MTYFQVVAHAAGKVMDGELVVINLHNGLYYSSSGTGPWIWLLLEAGCDTEEIARQISLEFNTPFESVLSDISAFLERLVAEDLLERIEVTNTAAAAAKPAAMPLAGENYAPPTLMTFDDMEQAFALDPPLRA